MSAIEVQHEAGDRFRITVRGHELWVDQPVEDGGDDSAPTPIELLAGALAGCVAFYAGRYLRMQGLEDGDLRVSCDLDWAADDPPRLSELHVKVAVPMELSDAKVKALQRVVEHCSVHNTLSSTPSVDIEIT